MKSAAKLAKLSGPAFDHAYAQNEVAYHQTVNKALENTLIPSASNPELKSLARDRAEDFPGPRAACRAGRERLK